MRGRFKKYNNLVNIVVDIRKYEKNWEAFPILADVAANECAL
jgi:hypothetical protein